MNLERYIFVVLRETTNSYVQNRNKIYFKSCRKTSPVNKLLLKLFLFEFFALLLNTTLNLFTSLFFNTLW